MIRVPDRGFFFLRTRGFCLLHDPTGLPDRERAFELARSWERFSMAYAALCLKEGGPPDPDEAEALAAGAGDNARRALTVTYFGVKFPVGKLVASEETALGVALGAIPIAILTRELLPPDLSPLSLPLIMSLAGALLALPIAWRNRRVVKTGRWYRLLLRGDHVEKLLPRLWGEDLWSPDLLWSRRGGMITTLWKVFDVLERERRQPPPY
ncbi:hypothetical protein [Methanopyrus kandleri]